VDRLKVYSPEEAVALVKETANAKFDETVEVHARLNVDPRHADQQVRGVAMLPNGLGRQIRVLVFAQGEAAAIAQAAGADYVGAEELAARIQGGWLDFEVSLATQDAMRFVAPLGRVLGPRGLMPNARMGTVVTDPRDLTNLVKESKQGRVEFRVDKTSIVHGPIGKASFDEEKLLENLGAFMDALQRARPEGVKKQYINTLALSTTMGPGIKLDVGAASAMRAV
jgi:large subunit ribosomal protein L1